MKLSRPALFLILPLAVACQPMMQNEPVRTADQAQRAGTPLELTITPAAASAPGGLRLPVRFTVHNTGSQAVHTCLTPARIVHLWDLSRKDAYTVAQQEEAEPSCEQKLDLEPDAEVSWTEEIAIPAIGAGSAKLVGFAQIVTPDACDESECDPIWLTASYAPFTIEQGAAREIRDLRTGLASSSARFF